MGTSQIYFPYFVGVSAAARKRKRVAETRGETILLVEDDTKVLDVAHRFLEEGGYHVISTSDIAEALATVQDGRRPVHLLATDVVMPGMSGRDLAERLRSVLPDLKTLYISGYTDDAIAHHGVLGPGVAFLEKPYSRQDLLAAVRRALDAD
jgi:DNA-binding NtrC family response regulator